MDGSIRVQPTSVYVESEFLDVFVPRLDEEITNERIQLEKKKKKEKEW